MSLDIKITPNPSSPQPPVPKWMGPLLILGSLAIMLFGKTSEGVPQWIGIAAAGLFTLAGLILTGMAFGFPQISYFLGPIIFLLFAVIFTWIGFAPGERNCSSGGLSFMGFTVRHGGGDSCKPLFGLAAVLIWLFFALALWQVVGRKSK